VAANPGWNYGIEEEEEEEGERAKPRPPLPPPPPPRGGLPLRRRRRRSFPGGKIDDFTSPNLIVDRVARYEELSAVWARDPFLAAGGDTRTPKRAGRGLLAAAFAAEHALLGGGGGDGNRRRRSCP